MLTALRFEPITEADARTILAWRYEGPYAVYNCPPADVEDSVRDWLDPANGYYAVRDAHGDLVGFCCFGPDARVPGGDDADESTLDVGLGLRPDLTGKGLGAAFVQAIVTFAAEQLHRPEQRLTVAAFNHRAIRVYERAGFHITHTFTRGSALTGEPTEWVQMTRSDRLPDQPLFHDSFVVPDASGRRILVMPGADGWALPQWDHPARHGRTGRELDDPFWPAAIQRHLRRQLGIEVVVLHADLHDVRDSRTGDRHTVFVVENLSPEWTPPPGARWVARDELVAVPLAAPEHRAILAAWFAKADAERNGAPVHGPPWQRPGWFATAMAWVADQLRRRGTPVAGPAEQLGTKVGRFLIRVPVADGTTHGTAYFKAVPAMYARELSVLRLLGAEHPASVPYVLAGDDRRHWLLMRGRPGTSLADSADLTLWEDALRTLAQIQLAWGDRVPALLAAGCIDLRLEHLFAQFPALLTDHVAVLADEPGGLSATEHAALTALGPAVRSGCERLAAYSIPPTLVHGDFLPANILVAVDGTPVLLDWCEATVSHPFFSPVRFLASAVWQGTPIRDNPPVNTRLRDAYLQPWIAHGRQERLIAAFDLARALQPLQHALTYWHLSRALRVEDGLFGFWERRGVASSSLKRLLTSAGQLQRP